MRLSESIQECIDYGCTVISDGGRDYDIYDLLHEIDAAPDDQEYAVTYDTNNPNLARIRKLDDHGYMQNTPDYVAYMSRHVVPVYAPHTARAGELVIGGYRSDSDDYVILRFDSIDEMRSRILEYESYDNTSKYWRTLIQTLREEVKFHE